MNIFKLLVKQVLSIVRGEQNLTKLKKRGLIVGNNFKIMGGCIIDPSHCWHIKIGENVTLAPNVHILAHDASTKIFLNYTKVANVTIGNNVFIGAGTIILPGVNIGNNVVIGAGSIVSKSISSDSVAVGNPAKVIMPLAAYLSKEKLAMSKENTFGESFTLRVNMDAEKMKTLYRAAANYGKLFIE